MTKNHATKDLATTGIVKPADSGESFFQRGVVASGQLRERFETFFLDGSWHNDNIEARKFFHEAFSRLCQSLYMDGLTYYRVFFSGQEGEYVERGGIYNQSIPEQASDEAWYQTEKVKPESIAGFMASIPENRIRVNPAFYPKLASPFLERLVIADMANVPPVFLGPSNQIKQRGYEIGSMLLYKQYLPGDPIVRVLQFVIERGSEPKQFDQFSEGRLVLLDLSAGVLLAQLKQFDDMTGLSSTDLLRPKAAFLERRNHQLQKAVDRLAHGLGNPADKDQAIADAIIELNR